MGSKTSSGHHGSLKRKRESEGVEDNAGGDYFFAKYLTSPELLELEVSVACSNDLSAAKYAVDCGYPFPTTVLVSATHSTQPSAHVHEGSQGDMVDAAESLPSD